MPLSAVELDITRAISAISPSVAAVSTLRVNRRRGRGPFAFPAAASAVVLDSAGLLITNQHVVDEATELTVHLADGRELPGEVLGGDAVTDIAVVRVDAKDLPAATRGNSEELKVGQLVLAIGNALGLPGSPTVSAGVVSAVGRPLPGSDFIFEGLIQTDAAINPGNSGGPLVDLNGGIVGINTAMVPFAQGVGFAIPVHAVERISIELRAKGRVVRPWMGVQLADLRPEIARQVGREPWSGLWVAEVVPRSPAHRAGLRPGDVLQRVGPFEVRRVRELLQALANFPVGSDVAVSFSRRGATLSTNVPLQEPPELPSA